MPSIHELFTQADVLRCLEQARIVLDDILDRTPDGLAGLPAEEQHVVVNSLSTVGHVLDYVARNLLPPLLATGGLVGHAGAMEQINVLGRQMVALRQRFTGPSPLLN